MWQILLTLGQDVPARQGRVRRRGGGGLAGGRGSAGDVAVGVPGAWPGGRGAATGCSVRRGPAPGPPPRPRAARTSPPAPPPGSRRPPRAAPPRTRGPGQRVHRVGPGVGRPGDRADGRVRRPARSRPERPARRGGQGRRRAVQAGEDDRADPVQGAHGPAVVGHAHAYDRRIPGPGHGPRREGPLRAPAGPGDGPAPRCGRDRAEGGGGSGQRERGGRDGDGLRARSPVHLPCSLVMGVYGVGMREAALPRPAGTSGGTP